MQRNEPLPSDRNEIAQELLEMLNFIQSLGHQPGYETYGETIESVYDINKLMRETRINIYKYLINLSH